MLSTITLGLRGLQMILAIALLGLAASLLDQKTCNSQDNLCVWHVKDLWGDNQGPRTVRYTIFLGLYGILISAVGIVSIFMDRIPMIIPLVGDGIGALLYLAGGIAWVVSIRNLLFSCSQWEHFDSELWYKDGQASVCRRGEAEHGLAWVLFAITASLVICDYFRRRYKAQSSK